MIGKSLKYIQSMELHDGDWINVIIIDLDNAEIAKKFWRGL